MQDFLFVKDGIRCTKINFDDILYIEGSKRYSKIVTEKKNYLIFSPLCRIIGKLPGDLFIRIHKSFIISLTHTIYFENDSVYIAKKELPIGRQYRGLLPQKVVLLCGDAKGENDISQKEINELVKNIKPN